MVLRVPVPLASLPHPPLHLPVIAALMPGLRRGLRHLGTFQEEGGGPKKEGQETEPIAAERGHLDPWRISSARCAILENKLGGTSLPKFVS